MRCTFLAIASILSVSTVQAGLDFTVGDFYGTNYFSNEIVHYDTGGTILESMTVPSGVADDIRGMAFGPDGLLYAVSDQDSGIAVLAMDFTGAVQASYPMTEMSVGGNISLGNIAFDNAGNFYVAAAGGVAKFQIGSENSGTRIHTTSAYDVEVLPSGNLLVAENYDLFELDNAGNEVREIVPQGISFTDNRGVEYDPASESIFVSMIGHSGNFHQVMKFDSAGQLLTQETFNYGSDMFLASDGRLIVGSRTQSPGMFNTDLAYQGSFAGDDRMFVTQYIPEPGTGLLVAVFAGLAIRRRSA